MHLRILTGYVAVLVVWSLDLTAPLRTEEAVFGVFLILAFFVPVVVLVLLFEAFRNLQRFTIYQKEHFELLQRHNRTSGRINQPYDPFEIRGCPTHPTEEAPMTTDDLLRTT